MPDACSHCAAQSRCIAALEQQMRALETVLENSRRSLAAEGRQLKKTRREVAEAKKALEKQ